LDITENISEDIVPWLPLTALTKKNAFNWTTAAQQAFQALKEALTSPSVLAVPDFSELFVIESDASATTIDAVLMQKNHPIAYISHEQRIQRSSHQLMKERC